MRPSSFVRRNGMWVVVAAWSALYVAVALWCTRRGEALPPDSVDYAEVARNLLRGRGDSIDHVAFHTYLFPHVRHPLEVHGMLAPLQIAALFAVWGPEGGLVRVPSIVFVGCLGLLAYRTARHLSGPIAGLVAASLVLVRGDLVFYSVLGADDVGAALFSLLALYCFCRSEGADPRWIAATGVASAIAGLQKFTGLFLPAAFGAFLLFRARTELSTPTARRRWFVAGLPVVGVVGLYVLRNLRVYGTFGSPYGGVEWFGKNSFPEYFAYYPNPPTVSFAWATLGVPRVAALVGEQVRAVLTTFVADPIFLVGLPALAVLAWRTPRFAVCAWLFIAGVVFIVCVPHHLEARYLAPLIPICAVATGVVACTAVTRARSAVRAPAARWLGVTVAAALVGLAVHGAGRTLGAMRMLGRQMTAGEACPDALRYLRGASTAEEPVLTSNPWFIAWNADRPAVNAPTNGAEALLAVARHYGVKWLLTGVPVVGALDLDAALKDARVTEGLHAVIAFRGATCSVYRVEPGATP